MVLADLGRRLNAALSSLGRASVVDERVRRRATNSDYHLTHVHTHTGAGRYAQGDHSRTPRDRRQRQTRSFPETESQGKGQGRIGWL